MRKRKDNSTALLLTLALLFLSVSLHADEGQWIDPIPGSYRENLTIGFLDSDEYEYWYRFLDSEEKGWVRYGSPLRLSALPGERRSYDLELRRRGVDERDYQQETFNFVVDKRSDQGSGGRDTGSVTADFTERARSSSCYEVESLGVFSPVEGSFANPQWLKISNSHCFEWVRYSIDGSDPRYRGANYHEPVLLRLRGNVELRLVAKPIGSDRLLRERISYRVLERPLEGIDFPQGGEVSSVPPLPRVEDNERYKYYFSLKDREVGRSDATLAESIPPKAVDATINYLYYRMGVYDRESGEMHQFRSLFWLDRRVPPPPFIQTEGRLPFAEELRVILLGPEDADIFYTTDGSTPDRFSQSYRGPFIVRPDGDSELGSVHLQAVSYYPNGRRSEIRGRMLPFNRQAPEPPEYQVEKRGQSGARFTLRYPEEEVVFLYEVAYQDEEPAEIGPNSPECGSALYLEFPHGYSGRARIRFAVRNKAGSISRASPIEEIRVDTVAPTPPEILTESERVRLSGDGELFLKIEPLWTEYRRYEGPVDPVIEQGHLNRFVIKARSRDAAGNYSEVSERELVIDGRELPPPVVYGIGEKEVYPEDVELNISPPYSDSLVYYRLEDSGQELSSAEIDDSDQLYGGPFTIEVPEGERRDFVLTTRGYLPEGERWSRASRYTFSIDKDPPPSPDLNQLVGHRVNNEPVRIGPFDQTGGGNRWFWAGRHKIPEELDRAEYIRSRGLPGDSAMYLEGEEDREVRYYLYVADFDEAGNAAYSGPVEVLIDRQAPEPPDLDTLTDNRELQGTVILRVPEKYPHRIVYEYNQEGRMPPQPEADSTSLQGELSLKDNGNRRIFRYRAVDELGNLSAVKTLIVETDREEPPNPARKEETDKSADPVQISGPLVRGVVDGEIYTDNLRISPNLGDYSLRYHLLNHWTYTPQPNPFSPTLNEALNIELEEGQEQAFRLVVGLFEPDSDELRYSEIYDFRIDKAKPPAPRLAGLTDGAHYGSNQVFRLLAQEGETISYYRIRGGDDRHSPERRYSSEVELEIDPGSREEFLIEYWSVDSAGHRSEVKESRVVIDKAGVYVHKDGDDRQQGSKTSPFRSLERALYEVSKSERDTIYLGRGDYLLPELREVEDRLIIRGGYMDEDWNERKVGITHLHFPEGSSQGFVINGGNLRLEYLGLSNGEISSPMIQVRGSNSSLSMSNTKMFHVNGAASTFLSADGGSILIRDSDVEALGLMNPRIIDISNSKIALRNTNIRLIDGQGEAKMIVLRDSDMELHSIRIEAGRSGSIATAIDARGGKLGIFDSSIGIAETRVKSTGIKITNGELLIRGSSIESGGSTTDVLTGLELLDSIVEIEDTRISGTGNSGTVLIAASNTKLKLKRAHLETARSQEFSNPLRFVRSDIQAADIVLKVSEGVQVTGILLEAESKLGLRNSELSFGPIDDELRAVVVDRGAELLAQENEFLNQNAGTGTAVFNAGELRLIENLFSHWKVILAQEQLQIESIEELEAQRPPYSRKNPHTGNRLD